MKATPVGVDLAKNVFQVRYVDEETGEIVSKPIKRAKFLEFFTNRARAGSGWKRAGERGTGRGSSSGQGMRSACCQAGS